VKREEKMNYKNEIREFINSNLSVDEKVEFSDDDNYFQLRFVNSLLAMKLVNFVESEFAVKLENDDLDIENFSTINNLASLVEKRRQLI